MRAANGLIFPFSCQIFEVDRQRLSRCPWPNCLLNRPESRSVWLSLSDNRGYCSHRGMGGVSRRGEGEGKIRKRGEGERRYKGGERGGGGGGQKKRWGKLSSRFRQCPTTFHQRWTFCLSNKGFQLHPNRVSIGSSTRSTVIADIFVRDLISYISYFWLKVRNLVAYENHARIQVHDTQPSLYKNL